MTYDYDVIVIGGGGAGMAAAITACDSGARVALLEAANQLGGSTALSGGVVYGAPTSIQRAAGIDSDTVDAMFEYYMTLNQHKVEPSILRRLYELRSEEHTSELQSLMRISYAVFCLKKTKNTHNNRKHQQKKHHYN